MLINLKFILILIKGDNHRRKHIDNFIRSINKFQSGRKVDSTLCKKKKIYSFVVIFIFFAPQYRKKSSINIYIDR